MSMGPEDFLKMLISRGLPGADIEIHTDCDCENCTSKGVRSVESVSNALLKVISEKVTLSGRHDGAEGLMKLTRLMVLDPEFRNSVEGLAGRILEIFPNKTNK